MNEFPSFLRLPSPLLAFSNQILQKAELTVQLKRDDLIHEEISGNKWRKLKVNLQTALEQGSGILTFGGAYSNHIAATAAACNKLGIKCIGVIRGEELHSQSNTTLRAATMNGMHLEFISREEYRLKEDKYFLHSLKEKFEDYWFVPEGGYNYQGMIGCVDIISELDNIPDYFVLAGGTGTTAAGLLFGTSDTKVVLISALKGGGFLKENIEKLLVFAGISDDEMPSYLNRLVIIEDYHFGGYGKYTTELLSFIDMMNETHNIPLDQVYTGKMMYAFLDLVKKGKVFEPKSSIVLIHTGGLQGIIGPSL